MNNKHSKAPAIVGMSGGVDSSVAALLLHQQGYDVSGLFMKNWDDDDPEYPCTAKDDAMDAMDVCETIGISMDAITFIEEYRDRVFKLFLNEYEKGRTPNPDILCNKEIKFKAFLDYAMAHGATYIATGHYAQVKEENGEFKLLKAADHNKDQTYFLYTLGQAQLSRTLFPLGQLTKPEVRKIAGDAGLATCDKKDSTGICFIGERDFKRFLNRFLKTQPGDMRTPEGEVVGKHDGLMFYTIGQRQGLGIGGRKGSEGDAWFVADKNLADNILIVVQGHDHPLLFSEKLWAQDLHWVAGAAPSSNTFRCTAKTRYRQQDQPCVVEILNADACLVTFDQAQRAITPGQSVVFYDGNECLGGGIIEKRA
jgi:tRNA-specific 2-thiouridylase